MAPLHRTDGASRCEVERPGDADRFGLPCQGVRPMRKLAKKYLSGQLSRRDFVRLSTAAGFSLAAARSAAGALESVVRTTAPSTRTFQGTGGELVAEQLRAMGTRFVFVSNSSGMGALADALIDRADMQFIQSPSEHQTVAIADGYAKATGQPS